jgi:hypothetical protein
LIRKVGVEVIAPCQKLFEQYTQLRGNCSPEVLAQFDQMKNKIPMADASLYQEEIDKSVIGIIELREEIHAYLEKLYDQDQPKPPASSEITKPSGFVFIHKTISLLCTGPHYLSRYDKVQELSEITIQSICNVSQVKSRLKSELDLLQSLLEQ